MLLCCTRFNCVDIEIWKKAAILDLFLGWFFFFDALEIRFPKMARERAAKLSNDYERNWAMGKHHNTNGCGIERSKFCWQIVKHGGFLCRLTVIGEVGGWNK